MADNEFAKIEFLNKFIEQLDENNIPFQMYDYMYGNGLWFKSGGPDTEKITDDTLVEEIYQKCVNKYCHTLADGMLTTCGKIPVLKELHKDYTIHDYDEVDVRNCEDLEILKSDIINFKNHYYDYKEHCKYCEGTEEKVEATLQL